MNRYSKLHNGFINTKGHKLISEAIFMTLNNSAFNSYLNMNKTKHQKNTKPQQNTNFGAAKNNSIIKKNLR